MTEARKRSSAVWKKGQSGNPAGRTPGVERVRQLLEPKREDLVAKAVEMALAGDSVALRLCIDRLSPPPRSESAAVRIPGLAESTGMADKARAVIDAAGRGEISPTVATELLNALSGLARAIETDELARRIEALEALDSNLNPRI